MNNYDVIAEMSLEELATWLSELDGWEDSPWTKWFTSTCCDKCESIWGTIDYLGESRKAEFSYCELEHCCKFLAPNRELEDVDIIKAWLESEYKKNKAEC